MAVALQEVDVGVVGGDVGQQVGVLGVGDHHVVVLGQVLEDRRRLGGVEQHVLDEGTLDLVAERVENRLAAAVMFLGPAVVVDRTDVGEAEPERLQRSAGRTARRR